MRAGLARRVDAAGARGGDERDAAAGRHVHDVQRAARLLREGERAADRLQLGDDRPRGEVVAHRRAPLGDGPAGERGRDRVALGVHRDRQPEPRGARHPLEQRQVVGGRELLDAARRHEGLEADDAARGQLVEPVEVARHEPAPQRDVDVRAPRRRRDLGVERGAVDGRRDRVERHVDRARRAAGGERRGAGVEALPVRAARVVEVDVRVDGAGQREQPARVDLLAPRPAAPARPPRSRRPATAMSRGPAPSTSAPRITRSALTRRARARSGRGRRARPRRPRRRPTRPGWWLTPPAQRTKSIAVPVQRGQRDRVVAGAARQADERQARAPPPPPPAGRRARRPSPPRASPAAPPTRPRGRARRRSPRARARSASTARAAHRVVGVADVERRRRRARDHVRRARPHRELPDRRHEPAGLRCPPPRPRARSSASRAGRVAPAAPSAPCPRARPGR